MPPPYYIVLGLDGHPPDLKTAKRAYAKKLRVTRPDEDPEGFMKLRNALDMAKREIAWRAHDAAKNAPQIIAAEIVDSENGESPPEKADDKVVDVSNEKPTAVNLSPETLDAVLAAPEPEPAPVTQDVELTGDQILMSRFSKAFNDPFLKSNKAHWSRLLDEKTELSIDEHLDFEERFRGALINAYNQWVEDKKEKPKTRRPIPHPIENLIFDKMGWRFLQETDSYKAQEVNWLKGQFDLYNRESPHTQDATKAQAPQFEDDEIGLPIIIWRILRIFIIIFVFKYLFDFF